MKQQTTIPKPLAPRDECLQDGRHVIRGELAGETVLCVYDAQHQVAATYHMQQKLWRMQCPIALQEYLGALEANGVVLPDGVDLQKWLDAVSGAPPGNPH